MEVCLSRVVARRASRQLCSTRCYSIVHDVPRASASLDRAPPPPTRPSGSVFRQAVEASGPRSSWTKEEISDIHQTPLMELAFAAGTVHRRFHKPAAVQLCTLMNIKTGGCTEDCSYCAQSSRYKTGLEATKLSTVDDVLEAGQDSKSQWFKPLLHGCSLEGYERSEARTQEHRRNGPRCARTGNGSLRDTRHAR